MIRLPGDDIVCFTYNNLTEAFDKISSLPGLLTYDKGFYNSLLYNGVERVIKRGKVIFETTKINPDDLNG